MITTLGLVDTLCAQRPSHTCLDARRRVGGEALIRRVVRRLTDAQRLDHVAVTISDDSLDELSQSVPSDVTIISCRSKNPIDRLLGAATALDASAIVRVDLHSPFVDPDLVDGLVAEAQRQPNCDYIGYRSTPGHAAVMTQLGLFGEWCSLAALSKLSSLTDPTPGDSPDIVSLCLASPCFFQLRFIPVPQELDRDDLRLRLSDEEDWEAVEEIIDALDPEELGWHGIARLLESTPALRASMRQRNAAEDWQGANTNSQ